MALGEQAPKSLAIRRPRILALVTAPPLVILSYIFSPVIWLLNKASNLTLRVMGLGHTSTEELAHSEEELRLIVAESVAGGHLSRNERMMIENVLNLEEKTARRVMVPRPDIVYLSLARPIEENLRMARQAGHTRFPLCEDDLTTVIGMIHVKDIFRAGAYQNGRRRPPPARAQGPFLPVTLRLDQLLLEFQTQPGPPGHAAGRIRQRRRHGDARERARGAGRTDPGRVRPGDAARSRRWATMSSRSRPRARSTSWPNRGLELPETDAETAGGLILDLLGRLAQTGDTVELTATGSPSSAPIPPGSAGSASSHCKANLRNRRMRIPRMSRVIDAGFPVHHVLQRHDFPEDRPGRWSSCSNGSGTRSTFRMEQTCCGQMHYNTGYQREAIPLVRHFVEVFGDAEVVVSPSASCVGMVREMYPHAAALAGDPSTGEARRRAIAAGSRALRIPGQQAGRRGRRRLLSCTG